MLDSVPVPFELLQRDGHRVASNGQVGLVLMAPEAEGRLFRRRAIKAVGTAQAQAVEWVVAELGGVFVYLDSATGSVIVSRQELFP